MRGRMYKLYCLDYIYKWINVNYSFRLPKKMFRTFAQHMLKSSTSLIIITSQNYLNNFYTFISSLIGIFNFWINISPISFLDVQFVDYIYLNLEITARKIK